MKTLLLIIRWIVGLLFIFSGLVKANDPLGLSYKMQEFFEVWGLSGLNDYTLALSLVMNIFEVLAGVAVIIGWRMKTFSWLLLLLIIFFTFLTGYAALSGKIKTCGCFGDCIPLTPTTSFIKDVILLLLILVLFVNRKKINSGLSAPKALLLLGLCIIGTAFFQNYVMTYLPVKDCLPFKTGANIVENMKILPGHGDITELTFKYKKDGKEMEYSTENLPADLDSTYEFVDRYEKIIQKGEEPKIVDFALQNLYGVDTTISILNQHNYYVMVFVNDFTDYTEWYNKDFDSLVNVLSAKHLPLFVVTSKKDEAVKLFGARKDIQILICDGTVIKTAARVNPTYLIMQMANIKGKYSYADMDEVIKMTIAAPPQSTFFGE
ncbi:DoxX family protein [soil metagenome]